MNCKLLIEHSRRDNFNRLRQELEKCFDSPSIPVAQLPTMLPALAKAKIYQTAPQSYQKNTIYLGSSAGAHFAFLKYDSKTTEIFASRAFGPMTFAAFESITADGIRSVKRSQRLPWPCSIKETFIYEDTDDHSLRLGVKDQSWYNNIKEMFNRQNLALFLFIYAIAVLVAFLIGEEENGFNIELLIQPSMYAPGAIVLYALLRISWLAMRGKTGVKVYVKNRR